MSNFTLIQQEALHIYAWQLLKFHGCMRWTHFMTPYLIIVPLLPLVLSTFPDPRLYLHTSLHMISQ